MNRSEIFEKLAHLEENINQINGDMVNLKNLTVELIEENVALQIENENL
ncbi:MAG: initiation control protein YabA, partial [Staphylococcus equorum]|nr:initiation control protein YabA [Staphylococcus equorum]